MIYFIVILILLIPLLAVVLDSQLGRALAARLERPQLPADESGLAPRVAALESEVERLQQAVEHVNEEADFLRRLLEQRPEPGALPPPGDERR